MKKISESGNAINVAHLEDVISVVNGYGANYDPSNNLIKQLALNTLNNNAKNSLVVIDNALTAFNNAVNAREIVFDPLDKLVTRIFNAIESCGASNQAIADAKTLVRKLQGRRAKPIPKPPSTDKTVPPPLVDPVPNPVPNPVPEPVPVNISVSQKSFDNRIENLFKLITLLASEPNYIPNETDLKVATLSTLLTSLKTANSAVINANTALENARISRNKILYTDITGLYDIQIEVKKYVKSVFGATSPEYKVISKIKFTKPR